MHDSITSFTRLSSISKTLRFQLLPLGETEHFIKDKKIIENDQKKAYLYKDAKIVLDNFYKNYLEQSLTTYTTSEYNKIEDLQSLATALQSFQRERTPENS